MATDKDIRDAIRLERACVAAYHDFVVNKAERDGPVWKIHVDPYQSRSGLDETLEGAPAWWAEPQKGTAEVLSVDPEAELLNLRFVTATPPNEGQYIRVYPPQYLDALEKLWDDPLWASRCLDWVQHLLEENSLVSEEVLTNRQFPWLREGQQAAFALPAWHGSFLHGPPGTGKTTTIGAVLATYLLQHPRRKILLLSTTNSAIDIALVSVDKALEKLGASSWAARRRCLRLGGHFIASNYASREHLLPVHDQDLLTELARLEGTKPDPRDAKEYAAWKTEIERIRAKIRAQTKDVVEKASLIALTTCRAVFTIDVLQELGPFDLVVFDEASQVNIPYALAIAPLGKRWVFAGDPQQLAPVVQSDHELARRWLGNSMFKWVEQTEKAVVFLDEQSRMAHPICEVVSRLFYRGRLRVAAKEARDTSWRDDRSNRRAPFPWKENLSVVPIGTDGTYSQKYHGWIRYESAEKIRDLVEELLGHSEPETLVVLTPFRAQRSLIRAFFRNAGIKRVSVSTVHRAQGSERHTVIFDPVCGASQFLQTADSRRLFNVAISRAQARLILCLSEIDLTNPMLGCVARLIESGGSTAVIPPGPTLDDTSSLSVRIERRSVVDAPDFAMPVEPISRFAGRSDFPACAVGKFVDIGGYRGVIVEIVSNGQSIRLKSPVGLSKNYNISVLKRLYGCG